MYFFIALFFLFSLFQPNYSKAEIENDKDSSGAIKFKHQFGFFAGYSLGSVFSNKLNIEDQLHKNHFVSGGLFFNFSHVDFARIQFETIYYQKGAVSDTYTAKMHVFSIPILARFQTEIGFLAKLGLGISVIFDSKVEDKQNPLFNTEENLKKLAFDLLSGIGWRFKMTKDSYFFLETRFSYTVNNLHYVFREIKTIHPYNIFFYAGFEFL